MRPALTRMTAGAANHVLGRIEVLALFPAMALLATWAGFDNLALLTAFLLSGLVALAVILGRIAPSQPLEAASRTDGRVGLMSMLDRIVAQPGRDTACIHVQLDGWPSQAERLGADIAARVLDRMEDAIQTTLRGGDMVTRIGDGRFGLVLQASTSVRMDLRESLSGRIAAALSEPVSIDGFDVQITASIGHSALLRRAADPAGATYGAAEVALAEAIHDGPGAIVAFAPHMGRARKLARDLGAGVDAALSEGALKAWFQPQINARTGAPSGMEALARWTHPVHGMLNPSDFMDSVEQAGGLPRLGRTMLNHALDALVTWDAAGANISTVSVNFSARELRQPDFAYMVASALERRNLAPERLVIEVLERVAAKEHDDQILHTLDTLKEAGHRLDLDNFGIGQASLSAIQRFGIHRLKIDRSFTLGASDDAHQLRNVRAVVALARELEIDVLASGVETTEDAKALVDLGCSHLQGFVIGRPLAPEKVVDWATRRASA